MSDELLKYQRNSYSQFGEDGVIEEILSRLSPHVALDKWCVEFGAWDGVHLSNTCTLIRDKGYSAVLIEGDPAKVAQLKLNFPNDNVHKLCRFVHFEGDSTLDNILSETPLPKEFDFLSIDIDGVDYYILEGLSIYHPKVICIEFNPSIPNLVDFVQPKDFSIKQGSSAKALNRLAESKGYKLVAATICNLMFVRAELASFVRSPLPTLDDVNVQGNDPQYLFVGYDGTILSNKDSVPLPWHDLEIPIENIQFLPACLRVFGGDYGLTRRLFFYFVILLKTPRLFLTIIRKRLQSRDRSS